MSTETPPQAPTPPWRRIYVDIPTELAQKVDVKTSELRMTNKQFYEAAIREKLESLDKPAKKSGKKGSK